MTDHKSWLWRKKPSEKTLVVAEKQDPNDEEIHILLAEKAELEKDLKDLNDKLTFALSECNSNDELAKRHAKTAQEALAGWEKAEAKAESLKEELNEALGRRSAGEERISQLEAALKECMQQLRFVREDKEQRIHDVLAKAAKDYEEKRLIFEEKLAKLEDEITDLSEALFLKEGHVEELQRERARTDSDLEELLIKTDELEKRNVSLTYEVRVLEKELAIRNEESEFNRRTSDATHKQHLENVKKIAKLESECQRLRVLVRKRLPGPAALSKMRSEVQMLERGTTENPEKKKISLLVEKCCHLEEENNALRETLQRKSNELQVARNMYTQASVRLSQAESQIDDSSKYQMMDDFAEMEKLALVSSCEPSLSISISKVIQIIEGINVAPQEYVVRVVQWKASEASGVVQSFVNICSDLLHGKVDFVRFAQEMASTLEWVISHCCMKEARTESGYQGALPLLQIQSDLKEEIRKLKHEMGEMESTKKEVEEKLTAMVDERKPLTDQLENQRRENEDLNNQLSTARQTLSSLEGELEKKTKHCEEMEATCLELQIQLDSLTTKDVEAAADVDRDEKQLQTDLEIDAASEKLAKCQETIFNLGKQLKALGPAQDNALTKTPRENQRSLSLLDKMLAEEDDSEEESPKTKEIICTSEPLKPPLGFQINPTFASSDQMRRGFGESGFGPLAIVPVVKKQSTGGLLRKLLWRKRKHHSKKLALPFAA